MATTTYFKLFDNVKLLNRLSYLIIICAIFIFIFSSLYYLVQNKFKIDKIYIQGDLSHVTYNQLMYVAKNRLHGTFFTLDINELRTQFRQIPWVKDVIVTRDFPHSVTVKLTEYDAVARYGNSGLVSSKGEVFSGATASPDLPIFHAPLDNIKQLVKDYDILNPFDQKNNLTLLELDGQTPGLVKAKYANGLKLTICGQDISSKVSFLQNNYEKIYQINPQVNSINMCYKNAIAINALHP